MAGENGRTNRGQRLVLAREGRDEAAIVRERGGPTARCRHAFAGSAGVVNTVAEPAIAQEDLLAWEWRTSNPARPDLSSALVFSVTSPHGSTRRVSASGSEGNGGDQ
jgi:hypothetical protein